MKNFFYLIVCLVALSSCSANKCTLIEPTNANIHYVGRINFENPKEPVVYWSASEMELHFKGSSVSATLNDENGLNYFNIVIDKDSIYPLKLNKGSKTYLLADKLDPKVPHTIEVIKRNEYYTGHTGFKGFYIEDGEVLTPVKNSGRLIEYYGNSITAGYAIENYSGNDSPDSTFTNNYKTYAALTARHFDADMHAIVRSGIGIEVSWDDLIMPEIYDKVNPYDSTSLWDFTKVTPDLVVINLLQNDCWLVKLTDNEQHKRRFGDTPPTKEMIISTYADFVKSIRDKYPNTPIICALGSMDATMEGSEWPGYVSAAVESLHDDHIYTHFFEFIKKGGHPRVEDDKKMAKSLISFIEEKLNW